ncbi:hypothetical protein B0H14DRAFT_2600694 [Mycena olivaceomarginata]|nr:hypothetical protein B0H14DRAFT_2600694 [Mycena olivaceomarginata]
MYDGQQLAGIEEKLDGYDILAAVGGAKGKSSGAGKFRCGRGMPSQPVTHGCVDLAGMRLTAAQNDEFEMYEKATGIQLQYVRLNVAGTLLRPLAASWSWLHDRKVDIPAGPVPFLDAWKSEFGQDVALLGIAKIYANFRLRIQRAEVVHHQSGLGPPQTQESGYPWSRTRPSLGFS